MSSNTYVRADIWTVAQTEQGNVVFVRPKESDVVVPIFIGQLETQSILIGLGHVDMPRPLTHDLLLAMLGGMGAELKRIEICDLRDRTFFARLILAHDGLEMEFDARPSDAIALAVRAGAEVYIAEGIVEEAGVPVDMIREAPASATGGEAPATDDSAAEPPRIGHIPDNPVDAERERLKAELELAVNMEDYEKAASIRDKLRLL